MGFIQKLCFIAMEEARIIEIAKKHIQLLNSTNPHENLMTWILTKPKRTQNGYYFEYEFELNDSNSNEAFGGAPGFFINNLTGEISDLSWQEFHELGLSD